MRKSFIFLPISILSVFLFIGACKQHTNEPNLHSPTLKRKQLLQTAKDTYVYGFPLVLNAISEKFMTSGAGNSPLNAMRHFGHFADDKFNYFTRPNSDMFYSFAWLDLSREPMLFEMPAVGKRFAVFNLFDAWGCSFCLTGTRIFGGESVKAAIVSRNWRGVLPDGFIEYRSPTNIVWLKGMIEVKGMKDIETVRKIQKDIKLYPLSSYAKTYKPRKNHSDNGLSAEAPIEQIRKMKISDFINILNERMLKNLPRPQDASMLDKMLDIGAAPGMWFDLDNFDYVTQEELEEIPQYFKQYIKSLEDSDTENGWIYNFGYGDYKSDYMLRARMSYLVFGAYADEDMVFMVSYVDSSNEEFTASKKYILHFEKDNLPPVDVAWSISAYNDNGMFVKNPLNRYSIGSKDSLKFNSDGSLDIYIQKNTPGQKFESNWLPVNADKFSLMLRCYRPQKAILDKQWKISAVEKRK